MNLAELRTDVTERCGLLDSDQMATPETLTRLINRALHWIETRQPAGWPWLRKIDLAPTLVAGQAVYPFTSLQDPGDVWRKVRNVRLAVSDTHIDVIRTNLTTVRNNFPSSTAGAPCAWATDGLNLIFGPPPDTANLSVLVDVTVAEPDLVDDADEPLLPASFHDTLVERAAYLEFRRLGKSNDAQLALQAVSEGMVSMRGFARAQTGPGQVLTRSDAPF